MIFGQTNTVVGETPRRLIAVNSAFHVKLKRVFSNSADMMSLCRRRASAGRALAWCKGGMFMLAKEMKSCSAYYLWGGETVFSRVYVRPFRIVSFRGWFDCHVAECFVFALLLRKWVNKSDIDRTSRLSTWHERFVYRKIARNPLKHLAEGYSSGVQSPHIKKNKTKNIQDRSRNFRNGIFHSPGLSHLLVNGSSLSVSRRPFCSSLQTLYLK